MSTKTHQFQKDGRKARAIRNVEAKRLKLVLNNSKLTKQICYCLGLKTATCHLTCLGNNIQTLIALINATAIYCNFSTETLKDLTGRHLKLVTKLDNILYNSYVTSKPKGENNEQTQR